MSLHEEQNSHVSIEEYAQKRIGRARTSNYRTYEQGRPPGSDRRKVVLSSEGLLARSG